MNILIRPTVLEGFRDLAVELGGNGEALLKRFGLERVDTHSPTALIPYEAVLRLLDLSSRSLACPNFGARLARFQSLDKLGPLALLAINCRTVEAAIVSVATHLHTYTPGVKMDLASAARGPSCLHFVVDTRPGCTVGHRQMVEFSLAFAVRGLHLLAGETFRPDAVLLRHESSLPASAYQTDFGVAPQFTQEVDALLIAPRWLRQPVRLADERLRRAIDDYLAPLIQGERLVLDEQVTQLIIRLLPTGHCNLPTVASQLSMHPRSLQRKLEQSGAHFEQMVDHQRRERVLELLTGTHVPLSHVAGLVGFSEQSSLTRSCRRWFGMTPLELRQRRSRLSSQSQRNAPPV
jgi:AraC-like DNA-binding protein